MFFLLSSFVSCSIEIIEKREPITVNPNIKMGPSQFVGGCREIRLEKNDSCLLSRIDALRYTDKLIVVLSSDQIYVFDEKGGFKNKVGHIGRSKNEYLSVSDIQISEDKLYVLSGYQKHLLEYNIDGTYLRTHYLSDVFYKFRMVDEKTVVLASQQSNDTKADYVYYDLVADKVTHTLGSFEKNEAFVFSDFDSFLGEKSGTFVSFPFDYTVYSIDELGKGLKEVVSFDFKTSYKLPKDRWKTEYVVLNEQTINQNVVRYLKDYAEVGSACYLIYPLFGKCGIQTCITRIEENDTNKTYAIGSKIEKDFPYLCIGEYKGMSNGELYMVGYADMILQFEEDNNFDYFKNKGLKHGDNPILFVYSLK